MEEAFQLALDSAPFLLKGAYYTVILSLGGMFFGLVMGFGLALMRLSRFKSVSWLARIYVSFFRGTPLLVQLFVIYYGLPQLGIELDPLPADLIGFSLNMAAYACEILRYRNPSRNCPGFIPVQRLNARLKLLVSANPSK